MKKRIMCKRSIYLLAFIFLFCTVMVCQGKLVAASQQWEAKQNIENADTKENRMGYGKEDKEESVKEHVTKYTENTKDTIFDGATLDKGVTDQDTLDKTTSNQTPSNQDTFDQGTLDKITSNQDTSDKDTSDKTPSNQDTLDKTTSNQTTSDKDTFVQTTPAPITSNPTTPTQDTPTETTSETAFTPEATFTSEETLTDSTPEELSPTPSPEITPLPKADFHLSMRADAAKVKAGEMIAYEIVLENTGDYPLQDLNLSSTFSEKDLEIVWEEAAGLKIDELTGSVVLNSLGEGEIRTFYLTITTREEQEAPIVHTMMVSADNPEANMSTPENPTEPAESATAVGPEPSSESAASATFTASAAEARLIREVTLTTEILPLKIEFSVSKTADRAIAVPGDTITYQICIRNTGERTLHSVLTTERFQAENISAQFVQKEGVLLNGSRTQALISKIAPGEAFGLQAIVTVPKDYKGQELLNEVIVMTDETGEQKMTAQAEVKLELPIPTNTPTPTGLADTETGVSVSPLASTASTHPKTGDTAAPALWAGLLATSLLVCTVIFWKRKAKSKR